MKYIGKILIIVENLPVPFDTRVWQEANALIEAGYKVSIICPKGKEFEKSYEVINNISIYRHHMPDEGNRVINYLIEYSFAFFWELVLTIKVLFKEGFDVIHACNPPDNIFIIGSIFKIFGKKFVFDHHDINPEFYVGKFNRKDIFYKLLFLFEKLTFRCADISIATNESYRQIAIERGGMNPDRVFVVRSGPDLERMKIQTPNDELKQGKKFMVGYVGVIGQPEGIDLLLQAADYVRNVKGRNDIFYGIVGGGPYLEEMRNMCSCLGLDDIVKFTGRVSDKIMLDYLNTADICVNCDKYTEVNDKSTMNKVLEYMSLGKPIVQFDLKEGRHSAQKSSLYAKPNDPVDLANKILYLINNNELRETMGLYARHRIETKLNWNITKQSLINAYDFLFKSRRQDLGVFSRDNIKNH